jgi:hypothetical protein
MKKRKIIILNRGRSLLHLHYRLSGQKEKETFQVRSRKVIHPGKGTCTLHFFYEGRTVILESSVNGMVEVEDVASPLDNRYMGRRIKLPGELNRLKVVCREQLSIASIVEGVHDQ